MSHNPSKECGDVGSPSSCVGLAALSGKVWGIWSRSGCSGTMQGLWNCGGPSRCLGLAVLER